MTTKVAINGFGRIGRNVLKCIFNDDGCSDFEVVSINDLTDADTLAHLYKYDSIQGIHSGTVEAGKNELIIDGKAIKILSVSGANVLKSSLNLICCLWSFVFSQTMLFNKSKCLSNII